MDIDALTTGQKTFLIAPAGYGKTYTIAACVKHLEFLEGKSLILTHTHAGVSSLKSKMSEMGVSADQYNIETISSFCQKYTNAFYQGSKMPAVTDRGYHDFIVAEACEMLKLPAIGQVIQATYERVFVDEYQDCSAKQHELVIALSGWIMTHVLGDPLQGIFGAINKSSVNFPDDLISNGFSALPELKTPHRWLKDGHNKKLGNALAIIRKDLQSGKSINVSNFGNVIEMVKMDSRDRFNPRANCWKVIWSLSNEKSVLIIEPKAVNVNDRVKFSQLFKHQFAVLEAIDAREFYTLSKCLDQLLEKFDYSSLREKFLFKLFGKTAINEWFGDARVKKRRGDKAQVSAVLEQCVDVLKTGSPEDMQKILMGLKDTLKLTPPRKELFYSIIRALETAELEKVSVSEAMEAHRNNVRRSGRKCCGKYVGSTLLTKGLEFDTVVILDAHTIECPMHLYVAMTRACKRLIVFTQKEVLLG
ncbi:UvrD-helicase domain-containing protein [Coraliomargarita sp. W4R72]